MKNDDSDIVVYGYRRISENGEILKESEPKPNHTIKEMHTRNPDLTFLLWNKAYRRSLFEGIDFDILTGISFSEDTYLTLALQKCAKKISFLQCTGYNYLCRPTSVTQSMTLKNNTDELKATKLMTSLYKSKREIPKILNIKKFNSKFFYVNPEISYGREVFEQNCKLWRKTFPESNSYTKEKVHSIKMWIYLLCIRLKLDGMAYKLYSLKQKRTGIIIKKIYIVSKFGVENKGGLERVNFYLYEILSKKYDVRIIKKREKQFKHGDWLFQSLFMSLRLYFIPRKFTIGTSWHSFLYPCNISIHHGTTAGIIATKCEEESRYKRRIAKMEQISAKLARLNIAVSENCKEEMIRFYGIKPEKIFVLNNFVNDELFCPSNIQRDSKKIRILFSGRLEERKGLKNLIALSKLISGSEKFELHIAAINTEHNHFFDGDKNTFIKIGLPFDKMPEFYNSGDIFYFPTQYEGFSMATLEALSCGIPVIGSKYAVMPELQGYGFTKVIDLNSQIRENLLMEIEKIVAENKNKKFEIHATIKRDFGRMQYEKKLFELIKAMAVPPPIT